MGMKAFGCATGIFGLLAVVCGGVLLGLVIMRALEANPAAERALAFGEEATLDATVDTTRRCQIAVRVTLAVPAKEVRGRSGGGFTATYDLPVRYTVSAGERELVAETVVASSTRGTRTVTQDTVGREGGTCVVEHGFAKFAPPAEGKLRVRCTLDADSHGLVGSDARLIVYDRVSEHGPNVLGGLALFAGGGLAAVIGLILFVVGHTAARRAAAGE